MAEFLARPCCKINMNRINFHETKKGLPGSIPEGPFAFIGDLMNKKTKFWNAIFLKLKIG